MENSTLAACILIQRRDRNKAIGIANDTQLLRGLSAYALSGHKDSVGDAIAVMVRVAYLKAMIEQLTALADRLVDHITANIEDDDTRAEGMETMTKLESYINHLGSELEAIL